MGERHEFFKKFYLLIGWGGEEWFSQSAKPLGKCGSF